ncbi:hypothetical protein NL676_034076 [Syzygium grande]|nr:hypothetical protein NL676_034076 [Syzygium grande]
MMSREVYICFCFKSKDLAEKFFLPFWVFCKIKKRAVLTLGLCSGGLTVRRSQSECSFRRCVVDDDRNSPKPTVRSGPTHL